jgi:hypothetical protein
MGVLEVEMSEMVLLRRFSKSDESHLRPRDSEL